MKKFYIFILLLFSYIAFSQDNEANRILLNCENNLSNSEINNFIITEEKGIIFEFEENYMSIEEQNAFIEDATECIRILCNLFNKDPEDYIGCIRYYCFNSEGKTSEAENGTIYLHSVKEYQSPYFHETVHAIAGMGQSFWLMEGLAVFLDYKYSRHNCIYVSDLQLEAKNIINNRMYISVIDSIFDPDYTPYSIDRDFIRNFYIISGSFVNFLIELWGLEIFMNEYDKPYKEFVGEFNSIPIETLRRQWLEWLECCHNY